MPSAPVGSSLATRSALLVAVAFFVATIAAAQTAPRERISLDADWRFTHGDPVDLPTPLRYDIRPEIRDQAEDRPADAQPKAAEKAAPPGSNVMKPWILPTGDPFIKDAARRHVRPAGNYGGDIAYVRPAFDDNAWSRVDLPHDWAVAGPFITTGGGGGMGRLPSPGVGWYRKKLNIPASDAGHSVFLDVDGAMSYAAVWLNGQLVGGWPYGYASWRVDLTPYIKPGAENQLAIRLDNPPESSRWYPGGGIYRHVWLVKTEPVHVAQWGTVVSTRDVSAASAIVNFAVTITNDSGRRAEVRAVTRVYALDADGRPLGDSVATIETQDLAVGAHADAVAKGEATVANPRLWGPPPMQTPNRYAAVTEVTQSGKVVDLVATVFGIRDIQFDSNAGIFVNGERIAIHGVNQHHDLGALGAAFNARAAERQLQALHEMGCNAIRMSHNPPAPELLELTDRMGFLVMDEAFDAWVRRKTPLDFHLIFPEWHEQDLRALVRRDRNHPSVILWSVGNEVGEQYTAEEGAAVARQLCAIVHEEDPTRPATSAMNYAKSNMPFPAALDVIALNYQGEGIRQEPEFAGTDRIRTPPQYPAFHEKFPEKMILSSETASAFSSRGVYLFPVAKEISAPVRDGRGGDSKLRQVSAYELHAVDFGSSADKVFRSLEQHPYVAGEFVWTGWDYLGEPTPYYSARSSYCGIIDLAGFRKDRFYLYQSRWRPELPMAHILPHWTWPERVGQVTPVHVFTSGDEAELFLNGRSLGRKAKGKYDYRLRWDDVVYEPGTLEIVAYNHGAKWAMDSVKTAGAAAAITLKPDRDTLRADGRDLVFITATITDAAGLTVPRANNVIHFAAEGGGEIIATDNGDPTCMVAFPSPERPAFSGLCLAIVRAKADQAGPIRITASAEGLRAAGVTIDLR